MLSWSEILPLLCSEYYIHSLVTNISLYSFLPCKHYRTRAIVGKQSVLYENSKILKGVQCPQCTLVMWEINSLLLHIFTRFIAIVNSICFIKNGGEVKRGHVSFALWKMLSNRRDSWEVYYFPPLYFYKCALSSFHRIIGLEELQGSPNSIPCTEAGSL